MANNPFEQYWLGTPEFKPRTLYTPFGFDQGDPLIICINELHMKNIQRAFGLKAYYCTPFSAIGGRRHNKVIVFRKDESLDYNLRFERWLHESVWTTLPPGSKELIIV